MPAFFHLRRPIRLIPALEPSVPEPFSYEDVGATNATPPEGWPVDRDEGVVGHGAEAFARVKGGIQDWRMFELPWIHLLARGPITPGTDMVFAARLFGVWTYNSCRIVYVIDEEDDARARFGFAYGTLAAHAVAGEERFLVTWDKATDAVSFEVYKFSLPRHPLVRALYPVTRSVQKRFSREVIDHMKTVAEGA